MVSSNYYELHQDRKGMVWDLLLYVPTVTVLLSMAAKFWYDNNANVAYLLGFLGSFFFIAGANRILNTRLMLMPAAPVAIEVDAQKVSLVMRSGKRTELIKSIRYYPDYGGRSFGVAGMDGSGRQRQYIFHKGQFGGEQEYESAQDALRNR